MGHGTGSSLAVDGDGWRARESELGMQSGRMGTETGDSFGDGGLIPVPSVRGERTDADCIGMEGTAIWGRGRDEHACARRLATPMDVVTWDAGLDKGRGCGSTVD